MELTNFEKDLDLLIDSERTELSRKGISWHSRTDKMRDPAPTTFCVPTARRFT